MPSRPAFPRVSWTELLRDFFPLQHRPLEVLLRWQRRFGPTFWLPGALPRLVLSAPEDVRHVLVARQDNYWKVGNFALLRDVLGEGILTSNGPLHDRQRRAWMPHFQKNVLSEVGPRASRHTDELTRAWKPGDAVELGGLFARVAVALLGDVLLGVDLRGEAEKIFRSGLAIQTYVGTGVFTPWPGFFRRFRARSFARARDAVVGVAEELLAGWKPPAGPPTAGLARTVLAAGEPGDPEAERRRRDDIVTLLLTGHETTANALSWTVALILNTPDVRAAVEGEARSAAFRWEDSLLRRCFQEALRLYPPAWCIGRRAMADDVLPGGAFLPAGGHAVVFSAHCHRDPAVFPDPDRFLPDRFARGRPVPPPYRYFPFGAGPRACLGEEFAGATAEAVLQRLFRNFDFETAAGLPRPEPLVTLRPRGGAWAKIRRRVSGDF